MRFSNNAGYVNQADPAELVHAFSHWTHRRTEGHLMVTDVQARLCLCWLEGLQVVCHNL